jgi:RND family efflux transporter MFP subunit
VKRSLVIIVGVVLVIAAVIALLGWQNRTASASTTSRLQTATVQRGTLVATVNAAGNVAAPAQAALSFQTSGRVSQVNVQMGDAVKQGQVLMELDSTDQQLALKTAQTNLASAQANFDAAKISNAQNGNQLTVARAALDKAQVALDQAQAAYNAVAWRPDIGATSQAAALQTASLDYQSALATYQSTAAGINDTALRTAAAQLDSAQVAVDQAQANLGKTKIVAPYDAVVSVVNYTMGDTTGSSAAVSIVNLSNLQISVTVAEVDLPKIKVGETAQVTYDALPGKTYNARVLQIGPVGTVTQGVVNYPVTIALTDADRAVKPGMTANLAVVVDQRENVLMVPTRAVRTQGNQKVVTVLNKDQTIPSPVTTGLSNDQFVEITNGLQEGDVVVLNATQTQGANGRGPGGIPGLGFPIGR